MKQVFAAGVQVSKSAKGNKYPRQFYELPRAIVMISSGNPSIAAKNFYVQTTSQTVWTHLGVLTVGVKQLCLDRCAAWLCPAYSLLYLHTVHSCLSKSSTWPWRVLVATALSLWCRAHFRTWWSLCVAGESETSCFGAPKSTFRDRHRTW